MANVIDIITVGNSQITVVDDDPTGSVTMPIGSLSLRNDGGGFYYNTDGTDLGWVSTGINPDIGLATARSLFLYDTSAGYVEFPSRTDLAADTIPGFRLFADSTASLSWAVKNGSDVYLRKFSGTLTASRTYTLPDVSSTIFTTGGGQTVTSGIWNGTAINETHGGTNQTSYALGDLLYASASNTLSKLPLGTSGQILAITNFAAGIAWKTVTPGTNITVSSTNVALTIGLSGTVAATNGGTGQSVYAIGDLLYASTTTALSRLADVATGSVLISGGVGVAPSWSSAPRVTTISVGVVGPTAKVHIAAGTTAASSAPIKLNSGSLMTTAEAGAIEFLTDKFYGTITTGAARTEFALVNAAMSANRVPLTTTNGRLFHADDFTWNTSGGRTVLLLGSGPYSYPAMFNINESGISGQAGIDIVVDSANGITSLVGGSGSGYAGLFKRTHTSTLPNTIIGLTKQGHTPTIGSGTLIEFNDLVIGGTVTPFGYFGVASTDITAGGANLGAFIWQLPTGSGGGLAEKMRLTNAGLTGVSGYNGLVITANTGVVTTGTWNGSAIADTFIATPYIKADGTRPLTGNWGAGAFSATFNGISVGPAANTIDLSSSGSLTIGSSNTSTLFLGIGASGSTTINIGTSNATPNNINIGTGTNINTVAIGSQNSVGQTIISSGSGGMNIQTLTTGALSLTTGTSGSVTIDSGTSGDVNLGNGSAAKTIRIGNSTGATSVIVRSGSANIDANTLIINTSGAITTGTWSASTIAANKGGTGQTVYAIGDLLYADTTSTLAKLADVSAGSYLRSGGVSTAPVWSTTTLPNSATVGDLLYASATNVYSNLADVAIGNALISGGVSTVPSWGKIGLTTHVSGILAGTNGGTGVNNGSFLITLAGNLTTTGAFNTTLAQQFTGTITLPVNTSTLATLALSEALTNKTGYNGLVITANTGVITTGTWNGTAIAASNGGTGQTVYAVGDLLYADTTSTIAKLADVSTGNALISGGTSTAPSWGKIGLTTHVSGILAGTNGGTGVNNGSFLLTLSGNLTTTGAFNTTLATGFTGIITLPTATSTLATLALTENLTNKTLNNTNTVTLKDTLFTLQDDGDTSKQLVFQLSGIATATTRTLTAPNQSGTIALLSDITSSQQLYKENPSTPSSNTTAGTNAVAIGEGQTASGTDAVVLGGSNNTSSATFSSSIGSRANSAIYGGFAQASGRFAADGDAQTRVFVLRTQTTNNTQTEMFLDGTAGSQRLVLPNDTSWFFRIAIVARRTDADNESAMYEFTGGIDRNATAASTSQVGTRNKTVIAEDTAAWDTDVNEDTTNGSLRLQVTGQNAKTINWVARVEITEVTG